MNYKAYIETLSTKLNINFNALLHFKTYNRNNIRITRLYEELLVVVYIKNVITYITLRRTFTVADKVSHINTFYT